MTPDEIKQKIVAIRYAHLFIQAAYYRIGVQFMLLEAARVDQATA